MLARKCERCGKYHDNYEKSINAKSIGRDNDIETNSMSDINSFTFTNNVFSMNFNYIKTFDLCKDCLDALVKWFENGK